MILRGTVVDSEKVLTDAEVITEDGVITHVGPWEGEEWDLGGEGFLILPGMVNSHTHAAMLKFSSLRNDLPTDRWLEDVIWPEERKWKPEDVGKWAEKGIRLMVSRGCTTINDHYFIADETAKAALRVGVRAFIGQTIMDLVDVGIGDPEDGFRFFERWRDKHELVTPTVAPHATDTVSSELLKEVADFARDEKAIVHIHLSQSMKEVRTVERRYGVTPVGLLEKTGILETRLVAAHGIYLTSGDIEKLSRASIVVCPTSNLSLEDRMAPLDKLRHVSNIAVGTDFPSPMDPFVEMKKLVKSGMNPREVLKAATAGGARALGIKAGLVREGYNADLIVVRFDQKPSGSSIYKAVTEMVTGEEVEATLVAGRVIYSCGDRKNF